jgi:hypothetical protein
VKRVWLNYWVDVCIGIAFVLSAASGLIFLLPVGSDSGFAGVLGIGYSVWDQLHTWSSLVMVAGVLAHLMLHWQWIVGMTKRRLLVREVSQEEATSAPGTRIGRRQFLSLGVAAIAAGVIAAGCAVIAGMRTADTGYGSNSDDSLPGESEQPVQQQGDVACHRGLVNDPYPGQCRHYVDSDGDGICDYSVPGSI